MRGPGWFHRHRGGLASTEQRHLGSDLIQAGLGLSPVNFGVGGTMHP